MFPKFKSPCLLLLLLMLSCDDDEKEERKGGLLLLLLVLEDDDDCGNSLAVPPLFPACPYLLDTEDFVASVRIFVFFCMAVSVAVEDDSGPCRLNKTLSSTSSTSSSNASFAESRRESIGFLGRCFVAPAAAPAMQLFLVLAPSVPPPVEEEELAAWGKKDDEEVLPMAFLAEIEDEELEGKEGMEEGSRERPTFWDFGSLFCMNFAWRKN